MPSTLAFALDEAKEKKIVSQSSESGLGCQSAQTQEKNPRHLRGTEFRSLAWSYKVHKSAPFRVASAGERAPRLYDTALVAGKAVLGILGGRHIPTPRRVACRLLQGPSCPDVFSPGN